ncbi:putative carboxylesterase [Rosa chinensis]|uniref:Putative carboxylesterase n=1 Tax=Rosa chinensis TaxID=74649 RepID=A0A2P6SP66_ROSCH|nr:putative aminoacrylate hydrolase RutD [Rosa chinensis]PRQ60460.1 putative carboxylesterase [Rosa chinensis]
MPFCEVASPRNAAAVDAKLNDAGTKIYYRTYGRGPTKVLLIIGLAGTHDSWGPQIQGLTGTVTANDDDRAAEECGDNEAGFSGGGIEVCAFDNRGMGRSSVPVKKSEYTTRTMAKDAIALMDHLGWKQAHVFGHSMGAMIACKLAAMVPDRVLSLALLNVTGGGFECLPRLDRQTLSIAIRFLKAKTPEQRAAVDLDTHYSKGYLEEYVGSNTRRAILYQEYVKGISATGMQSNHGFEGQLNACWTHKMTPTEIEKIRSGGFLVSVIHGRHDVIAQIYYAKRLAQKLQPVARMVDLPGGHLVSHERTEEVNNALNELIKASEAKTEPHDWTNLPEKSSGWVVTRMLFVKKSNGEVNSASLASSMLQKLHIFLLYFFGLFALAFEKGVMTFRRLKPARVANSIT